VSTTCRCKVQQAANFACNAAQLAYCVQCAETLLAWSVHLEGYSTSNSRPLTVKIQVPAIFSSTQSSTSTLPPLRVAPQLTTAPCPTPAVLMSVHRFCRASSRVQSDRASIGAPMLGRDACMNDEMVLISSVTPHVSQPVSCQHGWVLPMHYVVALPGLHNAAGIGRHPFPHGLQPTLGRSRRCGSCQGPGRPLHSSQPPVHSGRCSLNSKYEQCKE
jgi:hypothetical protein